MCDSESVLKTTRASTEQEPVILDHAEISSFVNGFLQRRDVFLQTCNRHGSPLYVVEEGVLIERAGQFISPGAVRVEIELPPALKSCQDELIFGLRTMRRKR